MRRILSRSHWRRLMATLLAVSGFVLAYEGVTSDSLWPWAPRPVDPTTPVPGARLQFTATAYCKGDTTASGVGVRTGIAAADKEILPVGSVVTITTDETRYNGVYTVMDTGPAVKGRELDLYIWSCKEALAFGSKRVQVEVLRLGWNPRASTPSLIERIFRKPRQPASPPSVTAPPAEPPQPLASENEPVSGAPIPAPPPTDSGTPTAP